MSNKAIASYVTLMTLVSTTLGGYVACGAQQYRVSVHGDEPESGAARPNTSTSGSVQSNNLMLGVHSGSGWSKNLPVKFKSSNDMLPQAVAQLRNAMATWESAVGKQLFIYEGSEAKKGSDFRSLYDPLNDQQNGHYYDFKWLQNTGKSNSVLATTIWENSSADITSIRKADIRYNAEFYLFGDALTQYSEGAKTIVDMESLALHEVGHLLGMAHVSAEDDRYSVMNPSLFIGEGMMTRRLSEADIERVRSVYGIGDATLAGRLEKANNFPPQN